MAAPIACSPAPSLPGPPSHTFLHCRVTVSGICPDLAAWRPSPGGQPMPGDCSVQVRSDVPVEGEQGAWSCWSPRAQLHFGGRCCSERCCIVEAAAVAFCPERRRL